MQTLAVNSNNDLYLDDMNNIALVRDLDAVLQVCAHVAKTVLGECVFDTGFGLPDFQVVFVGVPNIQQFRSALTAALLNVSGVTQVTSLTTDVSDGVLSYTAIIRTIYGPGTLNG